MNRLGIWRDSLSQGGFLGEISPTRYPGSIPRYKNASPHQNQCRCFSQKPRGVQRGAALCPFAVFSHSNVIYPLRASAVHVAYSREPQSMRPFGRGLRSPCGYYFPIQNLENISLTRSSPSDSPKIRPRLSYASVRSME